MTKNTNTRLLEERFLDEAHASFESLARYDEAKNALREWLGTLEPYREWGDFGVKCNSRVELRASARIFMEPSILFGYFRMWGRREGVSSDEPGSPQRPSWRAWIQLGRLFASLSALTVVVSTWQKGAAQSSGPSSAREIMKRIVALSVVRLLALVTTIGAVLRLALRGKAPLAPGPITPLDSNPTRPLTRGVGSDGVVVHEAARDTALADTRDESTSLRIQTHTDTEIVGTMGQGPEAVLFRSIEESPAHVVVQVRLGNIVLDAARVLDAAADLEKNTRFLDGHGRSLSAEQRQVLTALMHELERRLDPYRRNPAPHEDFLVRVVARPRCYRLGECTGWFPARYEGDTGPSRGQPGAIRYFMKTIMASTTPWIVLARSHQTMRNMTCNEVF